MSAVAGRVLPRRFDARHLPLLGTMAVFLLTAGYGSIAYPGFFSAQPSPAMRVSTLSSAPCVTS